MEKEGGAKCTKRKSKRRVLLPSLATRNAIQDIVLVAFIGPGSISTESVLQPRASGTGEVSYPLIGLLFDFPFDPRPLSDLAPQALPFLPYSNRTATPPKNPVVTLRYLEARMGWGQPHFSQEPVMSSIPSVPAVPLRLTWPSTTGNTE